jgi:hypothetical protein
LPSNFTKFFKTFAHHIMPRLVQHLLSVCLIGTGITVCSFAGRPLVSNPDLNPPLNVLGINGSPYGEVFAMAMQGPIDTYFHMGMNGETHTHASGETHDHGDHEEHSGHDSHDQATLPPRLPLGKRFGNFLTYLGEAQEARTNPRAASEALKLHLRRQAEDKLRFANQLDPAHYGNYVSLHFFLVEPAVGTRPQLIPSAAKLADDTIAYCLRQNDDPRPALTAAAAASNVLHLMFADQQDPAPKFNAKQMRQYMTVLDFCIARYQKLTQQWRVSKNWELISPARIAECEERFHFIGKIRDAAEATVVRFESKSHPQVSN